MNDFEKKLADALRNASEGYRPSDPYAAKERFLHRLRRRKLLLYSGGGVFAAAAIVAAFVIAPSFLDEEQSEPLPSAQQVEEVTEITDIAVGEAPRGIAFGDGVVWVANTDGTVMTIDPLTESVAMTFEVGGELDDIAVGVGAAWVSDSSSGTVTALPLPSAEVQNEPTPVAIGSGGSIHMDVAPGADGLWIAKDEALYRLDPMSFIPQEIESVEGPTDVAVGQGAVYVLGISEIARIDPVTLVPTHIADVVSSRNQDIAFRDGFLWIANGDAGEVRRLDPGTGVFSDPVFVGGSFSGIAVDDESVWVISGDTGDTGVLTRIDPDTLEISDPRAELPGRPYDITVGAGRVWVANLSAGTVTAVDPALADLPTP